MCIDYQMLTAACRHAGVTPPTRERFDQEEQSKANLTAWEAQHRLDRLLKQAIALGAGLTPAAAPAATAPQSVTPEPRPESELAKSLTQAIQRSRPSGLGSQLSNALLDEIKTKGVPVEIVTESEGVKRLLVRAGRQAVIHNPESKATPEAWLAAVKNALQAWADDNGAEDLPLDDLAREIVELVLGFPVEGTDVTPPAAGSDPVAASRGPYVTNHHPNFLST